MAKTCKCGDTYTQYTTLQNKCPKCLAEQERNKRIAGEKKAKKEFRKKTRELKEKVKGKSDYMEEARKAAKRYVRARDRVFYLSRGLMPTCCSCGTDRPDTQYAAGHYKTVGGHGEISMNEFNIHLQCNKYCNKELSGNINGTKNSHGYKAFMVEKYGQDYVDSLDGRPVANYSIEELKEIKQLYNYFALELEKELRGLM